MKSVYKKLWLRGAAVALAAAAVLWAAVSASGSLTAGNEAERMSSLEDAIRRAAVSCYAAEGRYPESLSYLTEKYGLVLDERYAAHYSVFAPNLPPDITVATKPTEEEIWGTKR